MFTPKRITVAAFTVIAATTLAMPVVSGPGSVNTAAGSVSTFRPPPPGEQSKHKGGHEIRTDQRVVSGMTISVEGTVPLKAHRKRHVTLYAKNHGANKWVRLARAKATARTGRYVFNAHVLTAAKTVRIRVVAPRSHTARRFVSASLKVDVVQRPTR